ncbi:putative metalloprotease CJM1_0395 family protein, partial [Saccharospirillum salsuginis]|uniref:putative metalloprotease CJM1_0395 family protein n=1 Tax=Saccharospirillum salsuginis TaxID=418750 RepID=UPI0016774669
MSTLSGIFPNAITPSVNLPVDPEQQAQLRRQKEAAVFSPVGATEATAAGQNRAGERPARQDSQKDARPANREPERPASSNAAEESNTRVATDESTRPRSADEASRSAPQQAAEESAIDQRRLEDELQTIRELAQRDREVRTHEQAHQAVGGQYAGAMSLTYTTGPDGKRYAVAGEVGIDISPVPGNPEATMDKAERIRRAALAPAEPSAQDRAVAAQATQLQIDAQTELRQMEREAREAAEQDSEESRSISNEESEQRAEAANRGEESEEDRRDRVDEDARERQNRLLDSTREITDRAL